MTVLMEANVSDTDHAKSRYSARDHFLSLTDSSNWPDMAGEYFHGYEEAMEAVHQGVVDFWPELSATELPDVAQRAHMSDLVNLAAECHRAKWQFDLSEDFQPSKASARALILKGFTELHRIGDLALKMRDKVGTGVVVETAPGPDAKLRLFLAILADAGGEASGNDDKWNWINHFCDDAEPLDTFNQASKRKFTRVTHDSDTDNSIVYLTDAGRAFIKGDRQTVTDWEDVERRTNVVPWCDACQSNHFPGQCDPDGSDPLSISSAKGERAAQNAGKERLRGKG